MMNKIAKYEASNMDKNINGNSIDHKNLGIYIHIPFCVKKCDYCDFLSFPGNKTVIRCYVNALVEEIYNYKELAKEYIVKTIFIGGGTPSSIEEEDISTILNAVKEVFTIVSYTPEITIECNPGTLTRSKLKAYKEAGINRISIGLQSANNEELKRLGRIHSYEEFLENYQLARESGFTNINIDLMSALPGQTAEGFAKTLHKVIDLQPEHISAYSLIIEEGTPFYEMYGDFMNKEENTSKIKNNKYQNEKSQYESAQYTLPSEEVDREIYEITKKILEENGYNRYEISNYAKKGYECIHNIGYWKRTDYLGIGLGASSLIQNIRYQNEDNLDVYIAISSDNTKLRREIQSLTIKAQMEEFMFLGLRMSNGIKINEFKKEFGCEIETIYGDTISNLMNQELIKEEEGALFLTDRGIDVSNYVLSLFLLD